MNALLPLLVAVTLAHAFTVLALRRSILTEKVSRRGYHLTREYTIDPLEILFVREVMRRNIVALPADIMLEALDRSLRAGGPRRQQLLYPVIDPESRLVGVVTRTDLEQLLDGRRPTGEGPPLSRLVKPNPTVAYPDEPLRAVVYRMAETGLTRFPVVEREGGKLVGMVALFDLLEARVRTLEAEHRRERVLPVRFFLPRGLGRARARPEV